MDKPLDRICFTNRKRIVLAIRHLLENGERQIVMRFEPDFEARASNTSDGRLPCVHLTDFEAIAIQDWLKGVEKYS